MLVYIPHTGQYCSNYPWNLTSYCIDILILFYVYTWPLLSPRDSCFVPATILCVLVPVSLFSLTPLIPPSLLAAPSLIFQFMFWVLPSQYDPMSLFYPPKLLLPAVIKVTDVQILVELVLTAPISIYAHLDGTITTAHIVIHMKVCMVPLVTLMAWARPPNHEHTYPPNVVPVPALMVPIVLLRASPVLVLAPLAPLYLLCNNMIYPICPINPSCFSGATGTCAHTYPNNSDNGSTPCSSRKYDTGTVNSTSVRLCKDSNVHPLSSSVLVSLPAYTVWDGKSSDELNINGGVHNIIKIFPDSGCNTSVSPYIDTVCVIFGVDTTSLYGAGGLWYRYISSLFLLNPSIIIYSWIPVITLLSYIHILVYLDIYILSYLI